MKICSLIFRYDFRFRKRNENELFRYAKEKVYEYVRKISNFF